MSREMAGAFLCPCGARGLSMPGNHPATLHLQPSENHSALWSLDSWFSVCCRAAVWVTVELGDPPKLRIPGLSVYDKRVDSEAGEQREI